MKAQRHWGFGFWRILGFRVVGSFGLRFFLKKNIHSTSWLGLECRAKSSVVIHRFWFAFSICSITPSKSLPNVRIISNLYNRSNLCFVTKQREDSDELQHVKANFSPNRKQPTTTEEFIVLQYINGKSDPFIGNLCSEVKNYDNVSKKNNPQQFGK